MTPLILVSQHQLVRVLSYTYLDIGHTLEKKICVAELVQFLRFERRDARCLDARLESQLMLYQYMSTGPQHQDDTSNKALVDGRPSATRR